MPSNEMTDVILQWTLTSAIARTFLALSKLRLCCFLTHFLALAIGEMCSNYILKYFSGVEVFLCVRYLTRYFN